MRSLLAEENEGEFFEISEPALHLVGSPRGRLERVSITRSCEYKSVRFDLTLNSVLNMVNKNSRRGGTGMPEQRKGERRRAERRVAGPTIKATPQDIMNVAKNLQWNGQLPNWTTVVDGRELPARLLLLKAAKVSDNNPTDAEEAAVMLSDLGFEVRYKGTIIPWEDLPD
jgi:hypothetical protein